MTTTYIFQDDSGVARLEGTLIPDPAGTFAPIADPTFTGTVTAVNLVTTGTTALGNAGTDTLAFYGHAGATQQAVTGALSTVADAPAKAVLTSIIAALVASGLVTSGTT
jgi:hypothetical protein